MSEKHSGAEWIQHALESQARWDKTRPVVMSDFGREVADILGQAYLGIYHIEKAALHKRVDWHADRYIRVVVYGGLSTFDNNILTRLIVLCFDRAVRFEIEGAANGYIGLVFTVRRARNGDMDKRLPYLEEQVALIRNNIGLPILEEGDLYDLNKGWWEAEEIREAKWKEKYGTHN